MTGTLYIGVVLHDQMFMVLMNEVGLLIQIFGGHIAMLSSQESKLWLYICGRITHLFIEAGDQKSNGLPSFDDPLPYARIEC